jgi:Domain of unknown function (DUF4404)
MPAPEQVESGHGREKTERPVTSGDLKTLLRQLHSELAGASSRVDAESRKLLDLVVADIERLGVAADAAPGRIESLALRFEVDHPGVATTLRQIGDVLGKAGI